MSLSLFIARRYLFSKKKKNFINIISILSMVGVAICAAALIIILSVFNGLGDLLRSLNNSFDPEIKIQASRGKSFDVTPELLSGIQSVPGVDIVTEVIEDYAYLRYREANQIIVLKGVSDNFLQQNRIPDASILAGRRVLHDNGINYALIGTSIQYTLSIPVENAIHPLQVFYIKNVKTTGLDPSKMYSRQTIMPGASFSIVQQFDENYVVVPLDFAKELMDYGNRRTALELQLAADVSPTKVQRDLIALLGDDFAVLTHEEQHQDLYRLLRMEKLFTFIAFILLLGIGSINIFFSLMMLALDKKRDISILAAMGADRKLIRNIFLTEGALISFLGVIIGLLFGAGFCYLQMEVGIISMGMQASVTEDYPVKMELFDFASIFLIMCIITLMISFRPAILASRSVSIENL